ncbi:hypothetical protein [Kitasatospora nipponensis]|uniref:hypothetical protein n=1 Tax=Kitasatospora nipponensis TaxID=258049 RepID=UPI0031E12908
MYGHTSSRQELDDYAWHRSGALAQWALDHPGHPDREQVRQAADEQRAHWLRRRESAGFATLLLRRAA